MPRTCNLFVDVEASLRSRMPCRQQWCRQSVADVRSKGSFAGAHRQTPTAWRRTTRPAPLMADCVACGDVSARCCNWGSASRQELCRRPARVRCPVAPRSQSHNDRLESPLGIASSLCEMRCQQDTQAYNAASSHYGLRLWPSSYTSWALPITRSRRPALRYGGSHRLRYRLRALQPRVTVPCCAAPSAVRERLAGRVQVPQLPQQVPLPRDQLRVAAHQGHPLRGLAPVLAREGLRRAAGDAERRLPVALRERTAGPSRQDGSPLSAPAAKQSSS